MHRLVPALTAAVCALVLAGCGGDGRDAAPAPTLPRGLASDLAAQAEAIAADYEAGDVCGAAQQADVLAEDVFVAVEEGRVPAEFQESLTSTAQKLVDRINCPEPAPPPEEEEEGEEQASACEELEAQKQALEEEKQGAKGKGREKQLDEQIKELEEQIRACREGEGGGDDEGDD